MARILMFVEDYAHEGFIGGLVRRVASDMGLEAEVSVRTTRGGHGKTITELGKFVRDVADSREGIPDVLVVAVDANCHGYAHCRREIEKVAGCYAHLLVCAIPDPHIERWYLADASAFKQVLGRGCSAPDCKCDRGRYKDLLRRAVLDSGINAPLRGVEYGEELASNVALRNLAQRDRAMAAFVKELSGLLRQHIRSGGIPPISSGL
jgi:hypothetical protein